MNYNYMQENKELMNFMLKGESLIARSNIDEELSELIKLNISEINGCEYCIKMHIGELRRLNVDEEKISEIKDYNTSELYSEKEKITLKFTEGINVIKDFGDYDKIKQLMEYFTEKDIIDLILITNNINSWNRYNIITEKA